MTLAVRNFQYFARILKDRWLSPDEFWSPIFSSLRYNKLNATLLQLKYSRIKRVEDEDLLFVEIKVSLFCTWLLIKMFILKNFLSSDFVLLRDFCRLGLVWSQIQAQRRNVIFTINNSGFTTETHDYFMNTGNDDHICRGFLCRWRITAEGYIEN